MSETPHDEDCIELDEPERIDDLAQLTTSDRILIDQDVEPKTVVATGSRVVGTEGRGPNVEVTVPVVRVQGDWANAAPVELTHDVTLVERDGESLEFVRVDEPVGGIIERQFDNEVTVRRTHAAGATDRVTSDPCEVHA